MSPRKLTPEERLTSNGAMFDWFDWSEAAYLADLAKREAASEPRYYKLLFQANAKPHTQPPVFARGVTMTDDEISALSGAIKGAVGELVDHQWIDRLVDNIHAARKESAARKEDLVKLAQKYTSILRQFEADGYRIESNLSQVPLL